MNFLDDNKKVWIDLYIFLKKYNVIDIYYRIIYTILGSPNLGQISIQIELSLKKLRCFFFFYLILDRILGYVWFSDNTKERKKCKEKWFFHVWL